MGHFCVGGRRNANATVDVQIITKLDRTRNERIRRESGRNLKDSPRKEVGMVWDGMGKMK